MKKIFALLTDFGFDFAVASIKGVLLKAFPDAQIIDVDHTIEKFNLINAAFVIEKIYRFLPNNTVFLCVVDPGVGSNRDILCVELGSYRFIGPNNGIFHYLLDKEGVKIHKIQQQCFNSESVTFHGRDIFAPAAVSLTAGDFSILRLISNDKIVRLHNLGNQINNGVITYIDSFGNIKTNITVTEDLCSKGYINLLINNQTHKIIFTRTFTDVESGELLCYKGSNATLEIAVNLGSAKEKLGVNVGTAIILN
jgi:S-adenosylmethionine hydrolase